MNNFWAKIGGHLDFEPFAEELFLTQQMDTASPKPILLTPNVKKNPDKLWFTTINISAVRMAAIWEIC